MYGLTASWKGTYVTRPSTDGSTISLTKGELELLIDRLLCRKERNNGIGRAIKSRLSWSSRSDYTLKGGVGTITILPSLMFPNRYLLMLSGNLEHLLGRINREAPKTAPKPLVPYVAKARAPKAPKEKKLRTLPGTNLHYHFRNHHLTWDDALSIIARSAKRTKDSVRRKLVSSLDERGVASLRLKSGFVFRVDLPHGYHGLINMLGAVELRTTDDNTAPAYRRLRMYLKAHFGCARKQKKKAQAAYLARKCEQRLFYRYA